MSNFISNGPWTSWLIVAQIILFITLLFGMFSQRFGLLPFMPAFYSFVLSFIFIVGIGFIGLMLFLGSFLVGVSSIRPTSLTAFLVGLTLFIAIIGIVGPGNFSKPLIHDITTDWNDPPQFHAARELRKAGENTLDYPGEGIARLQMSAYPSVQPIISQMPPAKALAHAEKTMATLGWTHIASDTSAGLVEAYDRTPMLGFTDDIVVRIQPEGEGSRIDVRSVSRVGRGDFGANARRIEKFLEAFKAGNSAG